VYVDELKYTFIKEKATGNWPLVPKLREQIVPGLRKQVKLWTGNKPAASSKQPVALSSKTFDS
jgi:hypothetical protein